MYTFKEEKAEKIELPGRTCKVLVGQGGLAAKNITFGVAEVPPLGKMFPHVHKREEEVIYVMKGYGHVVIDNNKESIEPGTVIYLPTGSEHYIHNTSSETMKFVFSFSPPVKIGSYDKD